MDESSRFYWVNRGGDIFTMRLHDDGNWYWSSPSYNESRKKPNGPIAMIKRYQRGGYLNYWDAYAESVKRKAKQNG